MYVHNLIYCGYRTVFVGLSEWEELDLGKSINALERAAEMPLGGQEMDFCVK